MIVGNGDFRYERITEWGTIPKHINLDDVADIDIDSKDNVFLGSRGNHPILVFDRNGNFISCWGEGTYVDPHGITISPDGFVFIADTQACIMDKCSQSGELIFRIGTRFGSVPFNEPTSVAIGNSRELFVCNGYGNFSIHKFSPEGKPLKSWAKTGKGPGQFALPHKIDVDRENTLYICDRNNNRIQLFTPDGEFIDMWSDFNWPQDIFIDKQNEIIYTVEGQRRPPFNPRVTIRDIKGKIITFWGGKEYEKKGLLGELHSICVDSHGDIYITEVGRKKSIQKYLKIR